MFSSSCSLARESFYLFAPFEQLQSNDVKNVISIEELKNIKIDNQFIPYAIGEYKPAITTDKLFSFFRFTSTQAYLIIIDKRTPCKSELQRYNFYGLLSTYSKGKLILSSSIFQSKTLKKNINLTNVLINAGEAFLLELFPLHTDYDESQDWWMRGIVYEIVLASYQDSNNDGIGDIQGLRQRLDYIQSLGNLAL